MPKRKQKTGPRIILRIDVTEAAERRLCEATRRNGMTHLTMHGRIIDWFANQGELLQGAILGKYTSEALGKAAETFLKDMARRK